MTERDAPAFPLTNGEYVYFTGLTKREYAAMAMMGHMVGPIIAEGDEGLEDQKMRALLFHGAASFAVEAADALLAALAKGE